jgi:para-aminobenzoate synthetase component 1
MIGPGRPLDCSLSPTEALRRWPLDRPLHMLHSGRYDARWARYAVLAEPTARFTFVGDPGQGRSLWEGSDEPPIAFAHEPFTDLAALLRADPESLWVGFFGYDLARWIERLPATACDDRRWPVLELGRCPGWLLHDRAERRWYACGAWRDGGAPDLAQAPAKAGAFESGAVESVFSRAGYEHAVAKVGRYIAAGDVFQVNLTQRLTAPFHGDEPGAARSLFAALNAVSPAWYGACVELADGRALVSTSPELFLRVEDGAVTTRPIKGTRPAGTDPAELADSAKDRAELNMIVDLLRNDLGRVCAFGSVRVPEPHVIEQHPTIQHGVATVQGRLPPSVAGPDGLTALLRAAMPGGSVTGAPKVRAMELIEELEPVRRGPYCGAIGWLRGGDAALNIAIRTLLADPAAQRVDLSVGGGVVADSDPVAEYQETLDKARAMRAALGQGAPFGA